MAIDYTGNDTSNTDKNSDSAPINFGPAPRFVPGSVIQQVNPSRSPYEMQQWVNRQTGEVFTAAAANNDPTKLVSVNPNGNGHNDVQTLNYDINTGQRIDVGGHPWLDALGHVAMIWGGPETAGLLSALGPGADAASALSGPASAAGPAAAAGGPAAAAAAAGAAGTGAATTGGILAGINSWLPLIGAGQAIVGGILQGRRQGQAVDAELAAAQNRDAIQIAHDKAISDAAQVNQQIAQKSLQAGDYQRNLKNAIQAGLLDPTNGVQDINFNLPDRIASHMGTVTGGLRPSAISNRGAISSAVGPQALEALQHNPTTNDLLPPAGSVSPNVTPYPSASGLDTGLGIADLALSGLSGFSQLWPRPAQTPTGPPQGVLNFPGDTAQSQAGTNPLYTVPRAFNVPQRGLLNGVNFYG